MTVLYVVAWSAGGEGGCPYLAFTDKDTAFAWCRSQSDPFYVAEVPIFPDLPKQPWYAQDWLKPDWDEPAHATQAGVA